MTLEAWNTVFQFASAVLLGLTFLVGAGAIWTSYLLNQRLTERISITGGDAAKANERAGRLELEAEQQRERAAIAERQLLELQQRIADRRLTEKQRALMLPILREVKRKRLLSVEWAASPEISRFGQDITEVLRAADWPFNATAVLSPTAGSGLIISTSTLDLDVAKLQEAFKAAGYTSAIALTPGFEDRLRLTVGSKP